MASLGDRSPFNPFKILPVCPSGNHWYEIYTFTLIMDTDDSTIRAVFHLHITDEDLEIAIDGFSKVSLS